jgi:hypothetical protein
MKILGLSEINRLNEESIDVILDIQLDDEVKNKMEIEQNEQYLYVRCDYNGNVKYMFIVSDGDKGDLPKEFEKQVLEYILNNNILDKIKTISK